MKANIWTKQGLAQALKWCEDTKKGLQNNTHPKLVKIMNEIGKLSVEYLKLYWSALPDYDFLDENFTADYLIDGGKLTISAHGEDLLFIEFGRGVHTNQNEPTGRLDGQVADVGYFKGRVHGEYSPASHSRRWNERYGIPAHRIMYQLVKDLMIKYPFLIYAK